MWVHVQSLPRSQTVLAYQCTKLLMGGYCYWPLSIFFCHVATFSLKHYHWNHILDFDQTSQKYSLRFPIKVDQIVLFGFMSRSQGSKIGFKNQFLKVFLCKTTSPKFGMTHHEEVFYHICSTYTPGGQSSPF